MICIDIHTMINPQQSWLLKSAIHSSLSALGTIYLFGMNARFEIPYVNTIAPLWSLGAVSGAVASLSSDYVHEFVKEEIPLKEKAQDEASLVISSLVSAGTFIAALHLSNQNMIADYGVASAVAVSVGAELLSSFAVNAL